MDQLTSVDLAAAWPAVLARMRIPGQEKAVEIWLAPDRVRPVALDEGVLHLDCATVIMCTQIRERLAQQLMDHATGVFGRPVSEIRCKVSAASSRAHEARLAETAAPSTAPVAAPGRAAAWIGFKILDDFVVGSCNRMAYDGVMNLIDDPRRSVNPLFIHGSSGLGKTHLVQGLALAFKARHAKAKVDYLTCEQFTNGFIEACQEKSNAAVQAWRVRMRHPDLLIIDDIHFLGQGKKERTAQELFSTFNELSTQGKKVVFTSDAAPRDIQYLEDRFVQRFAGGLVVQLERPDETVRREVVRLRAADQAVALPPAVIDLVVERITGNVRMLEGAVNKLVQFARSFSRPVDIVAARQVLSDFLPADGVETPFNLVVREVAARYGITVAELTGRGRSEPKATARHIAMYVLKHTTADTYTAVGQAFAIRSHASVVHACEKVAQLRSKDAQLDAFIADLLLRLMR